MSTSDITGSGSPHRSPSSPPREVNAPSTTPGARRAAPNPEDEALPAYLVTSKDSIVFTLHSTNVRRWGAYFATCGEYGILLPAGVPLDTPWITLCKYCFPDGLPVTGNTASPGA